MSKQLGHSVSFVSEGLVLAGALHLPAHQPKGSIVGCHGLLADKNSPKQIELARRCTAEGMAYFRFDHRGCGQSQGVFKTDTTLENRNSDLIAAVRAVHEALGEYLPIGLFGSSFGGTVCLTAAPKVRPFAIVTLAAPVQSQSIRIPEDSPQSLNTEIAECRLTFDIMTKVASLHHILVIHGEDDEIVAVENAHRIYNLASYPKKQLILTGGDHRISMKCHQEHVMRQTVQWFLDCYTDQFNK
jgi:alpha-beta hydrolase superfamily lysophospholipase